MWNPNPQPQQTYLHYHDAYGHQTWLGADSPWGTPTHNIILLFDHFFFFFYFI